jgi:hypothetical protein
MWYQDTINLFENSIVGPFDFEDGFIVPAAMWKALLAKAKDSNLYVGTVNRVVPLDKPDLLDRNSSGTAYSHLAVRWDIYNGTG